MSVDHPQQKTTQRYDTIQVLRFVAAAIVLVTHSTFYIRDRFDPTFPVWHPGESGVDIFFVISGFVMVVALHGRTVRWDDFLVRRAIRIVPMYWLATTFNLIVLLAIPSLILHSTLDWGYVGKSYLFIPAKAADGTAEPLLGVGWTLLFEAFFYVVLAAALLLRANIYYFSTAVLVGLALVWPFRGQDWPDILFYANPIVLEFLYGMLIARFAAGRSVPLSVGIGIIAVGAVLFYFGTSSSIPNFISVGLPAATVILGAVLIDRRVSAYIPGWLIVLGSASYSIYLFHPLVAPIVPEVMSRLQVGAPLFVVVIGVVAATAFGTLAYFLIERPLGDWLNARRP